MDLFPSSISRNGQAGLCLLPIEDGHFTGIGAGLRVGVPTYVKLIPIRICGGAGIQADIKIMMLGNEDAGKSTLIGVLISNTLDMGNGEAR